MATGRWKANSDGSAFYDPEDSGPNQVQPPAGQGQNGTSSQSSPFPAPTKAGSYDGSGINPWGGVGIYANKPSGQLLPGEPNGGFPQPQTGVNVGHDGTYNGMNREQWRDAWMGSGQMSQDQMKQKLTEMGATPSARGDVWTTPYGETYDLGIGFKTGNPTAGWTPITGGGGGTAGGPAGGGYFPGGFGAGSGGIGGGGIPPAGGGVGGGLGTSGSDRSNTLWNILMGRAGMDETPSAKDPIIAAQVNAYRAEQERATRNNLDQLAEAGGPNANLNMERRMGNEAAARATGGLQSQLMANELTARRNMIQNALSQMGGMLSDEQKLQLQRELGYLDAALNQQRINSANDQFMAELGLRAEDQSNRWDWLRSGGSF